VFGTGPNYTWSWQSPPLQDGYRYMVECYAEDKAGNVGVPTALGRIYFRYDITPPSCGIYFT